MTYIVALTGGIGSGKSTVADAFSQLGVPVVDADVIARQVVAVGAPALQKIAAHFGQKILLGDGSLNRALLREIIFNQPQEKRWLNSLLHPMIHQETQRQLATIDAPYALWVVPLLIENGLTQRAQRVLVVDVDPEVQLQRTMAREQAANILAAQATRSQRLAYADDIIENSGSPETIAPRVASLHRHYLDLAAATQQDPHHE